MAKKDRVVIKLADRPHNLARPTYYALTHMASNGYNVAVGVDLTDPGFVAAALAALLSDNEPVGVDGEPEKVWTPTEAAKLIPISDIPKVAEAVAGLVFGAGDETSGEADAG